MRPSVSEKPSEVEPVHLTALPQQPSTPGSRPSSFVALAYERAELKEEEPPPSRHGNKTLKPSKLQTHSPRPHERRCWAPAEDNLGTSQLHGQVAQHRVPTGVNHQRDGGQSIEGALQRNEPRYLTPTPVACALADRMRPAECRTARP